MLTRKTMVTGIVALMLLVTSIRADILFENPMDVSSAGLYSSSASGYRAADDFVISQLAEVEKITWGGIVSGVSGHDFIFTFYDNNNGQPGTILHTTRGSYALIGPFRSESFLDPPFFIAQPGETYWLSIYDAAPGSMWGWAVPLTMGLNGSFQPMQVEEPPGTNWFLGPFKYRNQTFVLEGNFLPTNISLDIKPGSCPNPLNTNTKGKGRLPMAILGTEDFDVNDIDPDSIKIAEVVLPQKTPSIEDVSAPVDEDDCTCQEVDPDGFADLVIHFSRQEILTALGLEALEPGTEVPITVTGELLDGTLFEATDCVKLVGRRD
ncbi:MAG: hypothetical protein ACYTF1_09615 [Planctomycetota bacterium]